MISNGIRIRGTQEDARSLPYRFIGDDRFGGWTTAAGGFTIQAQGTEGDDLFVGTDADERYHGLGGNDTIGGGGGRDRLFGDDGDDTIDGGNGDDLILGGEGFNVIRGGQGDDVLAYDPASLGKMYGGKGNDHLGAANSTLFGGAGDDVLDGIDCKMKGGTGNDAILIEDPFFKGHDNEVWGGAGFDRFVFNSSAGFIKGGKEEIHDLSNEDTIDLSAIDAKESKDGDQMFRLVEQYDGHEAQMTISYDAEQDLTVILLYTDKDMVPDGIIYTPGDHTDFVDFVF